MLILTHYFLISINLFAEVDVKYIHVTFSTDKIYTWHLGLKI